MTKTHKVVTIQNRKIGENMEKSVKLSPSEIETILDLISDEINRYSRSGMLECMLIVRLEERLQMLDELYEKLRN